MNGTGEAQPPKEQQGDQSAHQEYRNIFTRHEEQKRRRRIFHLISRHKLRLCLRQIERAGDWFLPRR